MKGKASKCQAEFSARAMLRGKVMAPYVLAWIDGRGGGHAGTHPVAAKALSQITSIARGFIDEDKAAGRPDAISYMESVLADGRLYVDRKRKAPRKVVTPEDL